MNRSCISEKKDKIVAYFQTKVSSWNRFKCLDSTKSNDGSSAKDERMRISMVKKKKISPGNIILRKDKNMSKKCQAVTVIFSMNLAYAHFQEINR